MNASVLHWLVTMSAPAADLLVSSVWKGLVLVLCVGLLLRCVPRLSASARSAVWTAVMMVALLLPLLPGHAGAGEGADRSVVHAGPGWSLGIALVWVAVSLLRLLQLGRSALRLGSIAIRAVPVEVSAAVAALLARSNRRVTLCVSADVSRPSVAGFFQPRILLPVGVLEELSAPELEHVVLHELEHLRRGDDWTNLLQKLSLALFPLHPALLWLDRRLCRERELACDDGVLRVTRARKAYAACLARLAEESMVRRGLSLALGLLGVRERRQELTERVHRILRSPTAAMSGVQAGAASAVLAVAVLGGSMGLARSPRLISFDAAFHPVVDAQIAAAPAGLPDLGHERAAQVSRMRAMREPVTMPMPVSAAVMRKPHAVRRVAFERPQREGLAAPYVVLTEWHGAETGQPRMTLTVARYSQRVQVSQPTYAAVPVQGGWLLIQL